MSSVKIVSSRQKASHSKLFIALKISENEFLLKTTQYRAKQSSPFELDAHGCVFPDIILSPSVTAQSHCRVGCVQTLLALGSQPQAVAVLLFLSSAFGSFLSVVPVMAQRRSQQPEELASGDSSERSGSSRKNQVSSTKDWEKTQVGRSGEYVYRLSTVQSWGKVVGMWVGGGAGQDWHHTERPSESRR